MQRKKTFILLEILLGLALVGTLILPFLRYPYQHMRDEIEELFEMQLARFAQERLSAIEEDLAINGSDSPYAFDLKDKTHTLPPIARVIELRNGWKREYEECLKFKWSTKKEDSPFYYALIHVRLEYKRKEDPIARFHTKFTLCKKNIDGIQA